MQEPPSSVEIVEVAPRDGFQSIPAPIPTGTKIELIEQLIEAGGKRIEIGSFVSPRAVPQMADIGEIAAHFAGRQGVRSSVLVPNPKGAELALAAGMKELVYVFSASEQHNQKNVRRSIAQSIQELSDIHSLIDRGGDVRMRVDLATAFDCPLAGDVPVEAVLSALERIGKICPTWEIALCDTTGRANPFQVRQRFEAAMSCFDDFAWAFHGHDTFGVGVANALFAHQAGVGIFDASVAGLGGCPFAPGATGNTATEDLVFAFEGGGVRTGYRLAGLLAVADRIADLPGASVGSHLRLVPRARASVAHIAA